jgi:hypothetical protein
MLSEQSDGGLLGKLVFGVGLGHGDYARERKSVSMSVNS